MTSEGHTRIPLADITAHYDRQQGKGLGMDGGMLREKGGWSNSGRLQNTGRRIKKGICAFMKETRESKMHRGMEFEFRS